MATGTTRPILHVTTPIETFEGAGVRVRRALPSQDFEYEDIDPFLLLDDFGTEPGGPNIPKHPHRGQEIITYVLDGKVQHADSEGNRAIAHAGGLQRIIAGRGIEHEEGPIEGEPDRVRGLQLWINLAQANKGVAPSYQNFEAEDFPIEKVDGASVKVLVGDGSPTELMTPLVYLDVTVPARTEFTRSIPEGYQGFAYLLEGAGTFGPDDRPAAAGELVVHGAGDEFRARAGEDGARFVLAAGMPHREPVRWRGPFVD